MRDITDTMTDSGFLKRALDWFHSVRDVFDLVRFLGARISLKAIGAKILSLGCATCSPVLGIGIAVAVAVAVGFIIHAL